MLAGRHHGCNCVTDKCFCTTLREMAGCECPSLHTRFQELSFIIPSVLLQDLHHAVVRFLISLLVCAVPGLYVITFTPSFISSPECADWVCLQAPVSFSSCFGTSFSAAPPHTASLTLLFNVEWQSWQVIFPTLRHGCFHVKTARFVR